MKATRYLKLCSFISLLILSVSGTTFGDDITPEIVRAPEWTIPASKVVNLNHRERIPNEYIVVFKDDNELVKDVPPPVASSLEMVPGELPTTVESITRIALSLAGRFRSKELLPDGDNGSDLHRIKYIYTSVFRGFSLDGVSDKDVAVMALDPRIKYVEAVLRAHFSSVESAAPWDLDRIDQSQGLDGLYHYSATGTGVTIWVLDSGIQWSHSEFGGRAGNYTVYFKGCSSNTEDCSNTYKVCPPANSGLICQYLQPFVNTNSATEDLCGHGTAVASVAAGAVSGVAKGATVRGIDVIGALLGFCQATDASIIVAGVDYVLNHKASNTNIINLSMQVDVGDQYAPALESAIAQAVNSGIVFVTSANNTPDVGANACNFDPSRLAYVITVGASAKNDLVSTYSNYGPCVTLFAPGDNVTVADNGNDDNVDRPGTPQGSNTALNTITGTSFSAPMVAGIAALYLQNNPGASPAAVKAAITSAAWKGKLKDTRGGVLPSANLLAAVCVTGNSVCPAGSGSIAVNAVVSIFNELLFLRGL